MQRTFCEGCKKIIAQNQDETTTVHEIKIRTFTRPRDSYEVDVPTAEVVTAELCRLGPARYPGRSTVTASARKVLGLKRFDGLGFVCSFCRFCGARG